MSVMTEPAQPKPAPVTPLQLRTAYGVCRHITRSAARNFYYAFLVLPRHKRDALSAVYAYMRHADDVSDDPAMPAREKRDKLNEWLDAMHRVVAGEPTDDPVLMALAHSQHRYGISIELLERLVHGTTMDCLDFQEPAGQPATSGPMGLYRTFDELYQYCYHVASVVGLACIKVFGYRDPAAEPLAERVGVAFQLTNIIRDVKEDASLGRIYLPQQDLDQFGVTASHLSGNGASAQLKALLKMEAERARGYYEAAEPLLPMIDAECQPALWTLVTIYRRLLEKIATQNFEVMAQRISLTTGEKLKILGKGLWKRTVE